MLPVKTQIILGIRFLQCPCPPEEGLGQHREVLSSDLSYSRCRQHFQMTSLKTWSRFLPYFTYSIYTCRQGEHIICFFLSQSDKNSGCYGSLELPLTYNTKKMKIGINYYLIADMLTNFYRNIPWVVLYKTYLFCCKLLIWLVTMATKRQNLWEKNQLLRSCVSDKAETLLNCF